MAASRNEDGVIAEEIKEFDRTALMGRSVRAASGGSLQQRPAEVRFPGGQDKRVGTGRGLSLSMESEMDKGTECSNR